MDLESDRYERVRSALRRLPAYVPPPHLDTSLRVIASRERARANRRRTLGNYTASWLDRTSLMLRNIMRPLALPMAGGLVSAMVLFSVLAPGFAMQNPRQLKNDVPTVLSTEASVKGIAPIALNSADVVVDLVIDENGRMVDYTIVKGSNVVNDESLRRSLENSLLFTTFTPGTTFGQPMLSKIRVSLRNSQIDVRG